MQDEENLECFIKDKCNKLKELLEEEQKGSEFCQILDEIYYNCKNPEYVDFEFHELVFECIFSTLDELPMQHAVKFLSKFSLTSESIKRQLEACGILERYCELLDIFGDTKIAKLIIIGIGYLCENNKITCRKIKMNGTHQKILNYGFQGTDIFDICIILNYIARYANLEVAIEEIQEVMPLIEPYISQETEYTAIALDTASSMIGGNLLAVSKPYFGQYLKNVIQIAMNTSTTLVKVEALHFIFAIIGLSSSKIEKYITSEFINSYAYIFEAYIKKEELSEVPVPSSDIVFIVDVFENFAVHSELFIYAFIESHVFDLIAENFESMNVKTQLAFSVIICDALEVNDERLIKYVIGNENLMNVIDRALEDSTSENSIVLLKSIIVMGRYAIDNGINLENSYFVSDSFSEVLDDIESNNMCAETSEVCSECRALFFE